MTLTWKNVSVEQPTAAVAALSNAREAFNAATTGASNIATGIQKDVINKQQRAEDKFLSSALDTGLTELANTGDLSTAINTAVGKLRGNKDISTEQTLGLVDKMREQLTKASQIDPLTQSTIAAQTTPLLAQAEQARVQAEQAEKDFFNSRYGQDLQAYETANEQFSGATGIRDIIDRVGEDRWAAKLGFGGDELSGTDLMEKLGDLYQQNADAGENGVPLSVFAQFVENLPSRDTATLWGTDNAVNKQELERLFKASTQNYRNAVTARDRVYNGSETTRGVRELTNAYKNLTNQAAVTQQQMTQAAIKNLLAAYRQ